MGKHSKTSKRKQHKKNKNSYRHKNRSLQRQYLEQSNPKTNTTNIAHIGKNEPTVDTTVAKHAPSHLKENSSKEKSIKRKKYKKRKFKKKKNNIFLRLMEIICIGLIIYSGYRIYLWYCDNINIEQEINNIADSANVQEVDDTENVTIVKSDEDKSNPYWDYIKMKLIDVDFSELEKTNSDVAGWIQVNGTNINYPFVQTTDNDYYLTHSFNKKYNQAGWVFLDYRNNVKSFNKNTIIYAHSRLDKTMFGSLKNLLQSDWYSNTNNHVIKLSTKNQNTLWQVFSVYHIPTTSDYLKVNFKNNSEFTSFTKMLQNRSVYKFNTTVTEKDKILTLSTCYKNDQKMVMHAKLIKYSDK